MKNIAAFLLILILLSACTCEHKNEKLTYPETTKGDVVEDYFGTEVADPYRWLETPDTQAVTDWITEQNKVTFDYLDKIPFRQKIRDRLEDIWNYPKYSAPFKRAGYYFYYKNDGLQNQSVLYILDSLNGEPRMLLDPNSFSDDGTVSLTTFSVSDDGKYAVFGKAEGGSDWNDFFVIELPSGNQIDDHLTWIKFSGAAWKNDGFYYGRYAEPQEGHELSSQNEHKKIYYHKLGTDQSEDRMVYEDPEHPKRGIYAQTTDDQRFLIIYQNEGATSDNSFKIKDLENDSEFITVVSDFENSYSVIDNDGDWLLVSTNNDAPKKRLIRINFNSPEKENWEVVIPEQEEVLNGSSLVGGKIMTNYLKDASSRVYVYNMDGSGKKEIELPGLGTVSGISGRKDDPEAFYTFTSYVYPTTTFNYNANTHVSEVFRKSEIDFDSDAYETKQVFFTSKDGTKIPMFITSKKGIEMNGKNPTFLYGYGGFNVNILPRFSTVMTGLLENGGIYAVATLRGGGEYGEDWHKDGALLNKQNVFDDFIGAAEYLIEQKYTSREKLAIHGRSNGGLLVGAVMAQRPDLCAVAMPGVGVMDMLRYHKFTIGHAWVVEYGSSDDEEQFKNLYGYSPLHNLKEGVEYPATMVTTADHDDRVVPAHSFKFISTLQEKHAGDNPVLIRIDVKAGHGAGKPTSMVIDEWADVWSFVFYNLGEDL